MDAAKILLSGDEMVLVQNAGWLLTKNSIIGKVVALFGEVVHPVRDKIISQPISVPPEVLGPSPKIFKGENYLGLPYVILDYPRFFGKENIFAIRTMFWWGHYFSITLHLKGHYQRQYTPALLLHVDLLKEHNFHIGIAPDEWRHELVEDNYTALEQLSKEEIEKILVTNEFCKLSARVPLTQWNQATSMLIRSYDILFRAIGY